MPSEVLSHAIDRLLAGEDLGSDGASEALDAIMSGEAGDVQTAGFLVALRAKGETAEELAGLAATVRSHAEPVTPPDGPFIDTCGTGGGRSTFNISTTSTFVVAGAGVAVAKHGNRSATSRCGSADVLEALGARIDLSPDGVSRCLEETGLGFMFAPSHHPAFRHIVPVRRALGVRTIFNLLGPLTNPAGAPRQLIGVADPAFLERMGGALALLGIERALLVHGRDGMDEVCIAARDPRRRGRGRSHGGVVRRAGRPRHRACLARTDAARRQPRAENAAAVARRSSRGETARSRDLVAAERRRRDLCRWRRGEPRSRCRAGRRDGRQRRCGRVADQA